MGLLNPFDRSPRPTPADAAPSNSARLGTLLPVLRSWWSFAGEALPDQIFGTETPCAPAVSHVGSDLGVALVAEGAGAEAPITGAQLRTNGLEPDSALALALDNLRPRSTPAFEPLKPGLFASQWRDG